MAGMISAYISFTSSVSTRMRKRLHEI